MKNITLILVSITVALAIIASIPFCLSEKHMQKKLENSRGKKQINYV
ncbi:MAG: hypothetical protein R3Y32_06000 [Bacillota bacterium]